MSLNEGVLLLKEELNQYETSGGIPFRFLRDILIENGVTLNMPEGKLNVLFKQADTDGNRKINYEEFLALMTNANSNLALSVRLSIGQRLTRTAVSSVVPNRSRTRGNLYVVDSYTTQYNCCPPPLFIIIITIAEVIAFIYYAVALNDDPRYRVSANTGLDYASPLIYNPSRRQEAWRFLTYMFLHSGYLHLIFNMIFQLLIGIPLEMVHKWWRVGIVYILGVIAGSLAHSVVDMNTILAGASGGSYALVGAHLAIVVMNWKEMTHDWMGGVWKFLLSGPVRIAVWLCFVCVDIGLAIWDRYGNQSGLGVGYASHFGGALAGLLVGIPVMKNIDVLNWEKLLFWVSLVAYQILVTFAVLWNVFYPGYPETDNRPCCPFPQITAQS